MDSIYQSHLEWISAQRLKAARVRVGEDGPFEAAVIFCDLARAERRALLSLAAPSAETRLRSAIERCGLLIEARAVDTVLRDAWPEVAERADAVDARCRDVYLARVHTAVEGVLVRVQEFERQHPLRARVPEIARTGSEDETRTALGDLMAFASEFPGDAPSWLGISMLHQRLGNSRDALSAVRRARALAPDHDVIREFELNVAGSVLSPSEFRTLLAEPLRSVLDGGGGADMAFVVAGSLVWLHQRGDGDERDLALAVQVCRDGLQRPDARGRIRALLKASISIIDDLRAGRSPDSSAFLNAGLPDLIQSARVHGALHALQRAQPRSVPELAAAS